MSRDALRFELTDRTDGEGVSPLRIPLGFLREFSKAVAQFLAGSNCELYAPRVNVCAEHSSLTIGADAPPDHPRIWSDIRHLQDITHLIEVDPLRRKMVSIRSHWRARRRLYFSRSSSFAFFLER